MRYIGMTTETEQDWCRNYTETRLIGNGEVVELGPWLGSLTIPLAEGLMRRRPLLPSKFIYTYDQWLWQDWMMKYKEPWMVGGVGDSFLPNFEKCIGWLAPLVKVRRDIHAEPLFESPIELLVVDAMKNWALAGDIMKKFYRNLIPGVSHVFHQDYMFWGCPWLHMTQWMLRDYFWHSCNVPNSTTTVFRLHRKIDERYFSCNYGYSSFSEKDVRDAFKYSRYNCEQKMWGEIDRCEELMMQRREYELRKNDEMEKEDVK